MTLGAARYFSFERLARRSPKLEGATSRYFDGMREARVNRQAYDREISSSKRGIIFPGIHPTVE